MSSWTYDSEDDDSEMSPRYSSPPYEGEIHRSEEDEISGVDSSRERKRQKKIATDHISSLPDSLLHHILTFLDMDQAVRTSVLSKRWQFLWTCMPNLTFSRENGCGDGDQFAVRVHRTLLLSNPGKLNKLAVEFEYDDSFTPDIDAWIRFATQRKVENLELSLIPYDNNNYPLPQHLYRNTSLINLRLSSVKIVPTGIVGWTSLKSLTLEFLTLTEEGMSKILSGSPVLEFLKMNELEFIGHLINIYSSSLKELVIQNYEHTSVDFELEISAPNLQSLNVLWSLGRFRLLDVSSLVSANIDFTLDTFSYEYEEMSEGVNKLLLSISHVKELELRSRCIEAFSKLESKRLLYFPSILKVLKLDLYNDEDIMPCLSGLLRNARNLETLSIQTNSVCGRACLGEGKHWESLGRSLRRSGIPLKTFKISGNCYYHRNCNCMLELVKFLLRNARVLEKMVVSSGTLNSGCFSSRHESLDFIEVAQELLSFPRSSPNAVVIFS